jgi:hypothetical protein
VEKYCRARQAADAKMAHAYYKVGNQAYRNTFIIGNIHCLSTATMVAQTDLNVMLYKSYV